MIIFFFGGVGGGGCEHVGSGGLGWGAGHKLTKTLPFKISRLKKKKSVHLNGEQPSLEGSHNVWSPRSPLQYSLIFQRQKYEQPILPTSTTVQINCFLTGIISNNNKNKRTKKLVKFRAHLQTKKSITTFPFLLFLEYFEIFYSLSF